MGRAVLPLRALDLSPGALNDLWLHVPTSGKGSYGSSSGGSREPEEQPRVVPGRLASGSGGGSVALSVSSREDSASRLQQRPPSPQLPTTAAAAGASGRSSPQLQGEPPPRLQCVSGASAAMQRLRQLSPLDMLRCKECMLRVKATYLPLTEAEVAALAKAAAREASHAQPGGAAAVGPGVSRTSLLGSPRIANLLRSGVLYIYLDRAANLSSSAAQGFTRNM